MVNYATTCMSMQKAILLIFFVVLLHHCTCESLWQQADKKVASGAYDEAVKLYNEALGEFSFHTNNN